MSGGGLNYVTYGQPAQDALLLIHALGADLRFWEEAGPALGARCFCIAPDLRAAGSSPQSDAPVAVDQHLADLEALRRALGLARVVPVGCAMGGLVGACYAARHPDLVPALVMTNPGLRNTDASKRMLRERVEEIRRRGLGFLVPAAVDRTFMNQPRDARYERHLARYAAQDPNGYIQSELGFLDIDISGIAASIGCPTLLVPGEHDILMAAEDAAILARVMPNAQLRPMSGAAHFVPLQAPDRFAAAVFAFFAALPGGSPFPPAA